MANKWCPLKVIMLLILCILISGCQKWEGCENYSATDAIWLSDENSPNYRHLGASNLPGSFVFDAGYLEHLVQLNHFDVSEGQDEVLFGLRGCQIIDDDSGDFVTSIELKEVVPDHKNYSDVIGVWRRSTGQIAVFQGSTVPNWDFMCQQAELGGHQANMLPTGRYIYQVGRHRDIDGAFRLEAEVVVLRSNDDLVYETTDDWEVWTPLDNIHPGGCPDEPFSSAGCQTVMGTFGEACPGFYRNEPDEHAGHWGMLRERAGLDPHDNRDKWEAPFVYVLLTCREAGLVGSLSDPTTLTRLRFGSNGLAVEALQNALRNEGYSSVPDDGVMGPETTFAYILWQQNEYDGAADGIVTPGEALTLGFNLDE